jgi:hypothetical protein
MMGKLCVVTFNTAQQQGNRSESTTEFGFFSDRIPILEART